MEPKILLAQLRALLQRGPDFATYAPASMDHQMWLGQAHALLSRWDTQEAIGFRVAMDALPIDFARDVETGKVFATINRAIADLELKVPADAQVALAAGEVYNFFGNSTA